MMKPKTMSQCVQALLDTMKRGDDVVGFILFDKSKNEFMLIWSGGIKDTLEAELLLQSQLPFSETKKYKTSSVL